MSNPLRLNLYDQDGRTLLARDVTKNGAERWVRKNISVHPRMKLAIYHTDPVINEINGTHHGWRYSIYYSWG